MTEPPPFPGSWMRMFKKEEKQADEIRKYLQVVINLSKQNEKVRNSLEEEFEVNDLFRHIRNADIVMVEYLLKQKSNLARWPSQRGKKTDSQLVGKRATSHLHMAAAWGNEKCIKLLIDYGDKADTVDNYMLTPIQIAQKRGHQGVVRLLLDSVKESNQNIFPGSTTKAFDDNLELPTIYTKLPLNRRFVVWVNPFSGRKQGVAMWENLVKPIFDELKIRYEVVITEYQGHVKKYAANLDFREYDAFLIISGDGLLFELLNGLYRNVDGPALLRRMQIGILPAGSGNALCGSLGIKSILDGAMQIVKGRIKHCDVCKIKQPGVQDHLSIIEITWGTISSIDFDSEKYLRWMGEPRFTVQGVLEILWKKQYQARVIARKFHLTADEKRSERDYLIVNPDWWKKETPIPPPGWTDYGTTCYNMVHCGVTPYISINSHPCTKIECGDGFMQLIMARNCSRMQLASVLRSLDDGSLISQRSVTWQRTTSCVLIPDTEVECFVDIDGERFKNLRTHMEFNRTVTICC